MYQPYPTGAQMPDIERPPVPSQVANAVKVMYVGAVTSIIGIIIDILTVNATKSAIERRSHKLSVHQIDASQHALIAGFIVGGLIGAAAWIIVARNCQGGKNWARITGSVFFGIATIDTIVGLTAPLAGAVKIWGVVVWLVGLAAVVLLWQRPSTEYFTAPRPS
jgi:hypothetical protein